MVSIKDVAKKAGVSISTVSNVLNKSKFVSPTLEQRVLIAVKELKYFPDPVAKSMKSRHSRNIGVITTDICGLFYPYVMKGLYEVFEASGYNMIIVDSNGLTDQIGSINRVMKGLNHLIRSRVDGIVFASIFPESIEAQQVKFMLKMAEGRKNVALVSIEVDFTKYNIDSVFTNSYIGSKIAVEHLIHMGCKKIGHITGPLFIRVAQDRLQGYRQVLKARNLECSDRLITNGDYTHQSGYSAMRELLTQSPDIDGVFVANDQMAVGAMRAIHGAGRRVPHDIKVIGYDDVFISSVMEPSLSTVHIQKKRMGIEAASLLLERINSSKPFPEAKKVELSPSLVVRRSTDIGAPEDWILVDW